MGKQVAANSKENKRDRREPESYEIERALQEKEEEAVLTQSGREVPIR